MRAWDEWRLCHEQGIWTIWQNVFITYLKLIGVLWNLWRPGSKKIIYHFPVVFSYVSPLYIRCLSHCKNNELVLHGIRKEAQLFSNHLRCQSKVKPVIPPTGHSMQMPQEYVYGPTEGSWTSLPNDSRSHKPHAQRKGWFPTCDI